MLQIQNKNLRVTWTPETRRLSLHSRVTDRVFAVSPQTQVPNTSSIVPVSDERLGDGQAIELAYSDGRSDRYLLLGDLSFVLVRSRIRNITGTEQVLNHVPGPALSLDLNSSPDVARAFGTAGLTAVDQHPGSYAYLAIVNPQHRHGVVTGWLTHNRGSGVVFSGVKDGHVHLEGRLDYGRLRLVPGHTVELETFALGWFEDARIGLETWADLVAKIYDIKLPSQPAGYCTWYSDRHGQASDQQHLRELADFAAKNLARFGFNTVQIDDYWQMGKRRNGPGKNFTTVNPDGPYPGGMKPAADAIRADGMRPGIWLMPFAGDHQDPFFASHADWFVKRQDGSPYETEWGGTCMDMTHPAAREHLRDVIHRIVHEWGYTYLKLDGLWTGTATKQVYVNNQYVEDGIGDAVFQDRDKTNIEAFRDGLSLVRREAGDGVFLLGCCVSQNMRSLGASFGLVDAMRIGPDNGARWPDVMTGPVYGSRRYFLHGRVWYNDPDPVYVREKMPLTHARLICSWAAISGQMTINSDWLPDLPPDRLDILKRALPPHGLRPRPVDLFEHDPPRIWLLTDERHVPRRDVVALYNWDDKPVEIKCDLERIGLAAGTTYTAFDYWENRLIEPVRDRLELTVPAQSCRIIAVRPAASHLQVVSTSRHITQGIIDLLEEKWDEGTHELAGRSRVVGGDPYELRLVKPSDSMVASMRVEVSAADKAAGVIASSREENRMVRVLIVSPHSRDVAWAIRAAD